MKSCLMKCTDRIEYDMVVMISIIHFVVFPRCSCLNRSQIVHRGMHIRMHVCCGYVIE
jgi:hypothetical protein